jgi:hypothetical protein
VLTQDTAVRFAPVRFGPFSSVLVKFTPAKSALLRLIKLRFASLRFAPLSLAMPWAADTGGRTASCASVMWMVAAGREMMDGDLCVAPPDDANVVSDLSPGQLDEWLGRRWIGGLLLAAAVVLPLLRQRGTPSWQTVWPEDGQLYTDQAIWHGGVRSIFLEHGGYLQLPPRLFAIPTPYFSLRYLALYCALAAAIAGAFLAWSVYHLSRGWVSSRLVRVVLASFVVLMPSLGWEITGSITNTIWVFMAVLPWALISMEETQRNVALRSVLAFLGATASLLSLLFIPLAVGWLAYRRTRSTLIVVVSFLVGMAIQGGVTLASGQPRNFFPIERNLSQLRDDVAAHMFGVFLLGPRWETDLWNSDWKWVVILAPLIVVAMLVLLAWGAGRRAQVMAGVFTVFAVVLYVVPVWGRGTNQVLVHEVYVSNQRYAVVPVMLLASAFAILIAPTSVSDRRLATRIGRPTFALQAALLLVVCFSITTIRSTDPPWTSRVERVQAQHCVGRPSSTVVIIPNSSVNLLFVKAPNGLYPLTVRCSNLN